MRLSWAIEGSRGIGRHLASRLVAEGERVVDAPPKLSARTRVFTAGQGRKTDATDAHSVALAATRMRGLHLVTGDAQLEVLRVLADRRRALGEDHTRVQSMTDSPGQCAPERLRIGRGYALITNAA